MLGPLSNSLERQKALGVTLQARIWWYASRQSITIDRAAYESWFAASESRGVGVDAALLEKISEIQTRMGISSPSFSSSQTGNGDGGNSLPAWMVSAPQKVDLAKKADDGAGVEHTGGGTSGGGGGGGGEAPYPAHFQAIIEAVTTGKPVVGVREIPNTVVRQAVSFLFPLLVISRLSICLSVLLFSLDAASEFMLILEQGIHPVGKMQPPRKPWERQQGVAGDESSTFAENAGGLTGQLDKEFPPMGEPVQTAE